MKKLLIVLMFLPMVVGAQFRFGVKAGGNLSTLTNEYTDNLDPRSVLGFHAGGVIEYPVVGGLGVFAQPMFLKSGGKWFCNATIIMAETGKAATEGAYKHFDISSLRLPFGFKYSIDANAFKPYASVSPYVDYGLSATYRADWFDFSTDLYNNDSQDIDYFRRFTFGISAGIGVEYSKFTLSLDYQLGLNSLSTYDNKKLNAALLSLGYYFN